MKLLIVDDEPHVITVAKLLIDRKAHGITELYEASDADGALAVIRREKPELLLSDIRLPRLNGLELIEQVKELSPSTRTVMMSAYSDFFYAQKAVQLGCVDFLLKPLNEKNLNNAIAKAVQQYQSQTSLLTSSLRSRTQNMLSFYFNHPGDPGSFQSLCQAAPFYESMTSCRVGVMCTRQLPPNSNCTDIYSLADFCHDFFYARKLGAAAMYGTGGDILMLLMDRGEDLPALCRELLAQVEERFGVVLHIGLSDRVPFPQGGDAAFQSARESAVSFDLLRSRDRVHLRAQPAQALPVYTQMESGLYSALLSGQDDRLLQACQSLTDQLTGQSVLTIRLLENFRFAYTGLRSRWCISLQQEKGAPALAPAPLRLVFFSPDGHFSPESFTQSLYQDLRGLAGQFLPTPPQLSVHDSIRQVHQYITSHFSRELSLEGLAKQFSVSPSHLSREFKKEYCIGLVDYITQVRIGQAQKLLLNSDMRLSEIAEAVGFSDSKYFSRVFKRVVRKTPAEFRAQAPHGSFL